MSAPRTTNLIFEELKGVIADIDNVVGSTVANLHGIIATSTLSGLPTGVNDSWYLVNVTDYPTEPTLPQLADKIAFEQPGFTTIGVSDSVLSYSPAVDQRAKAHVFITSVDAVGSLPVTLGIDAVGYQIQVYVDRVRLGGTRDTYTVPLTLQSGRREVYVVCHGGIGPISITTPTTVQLLGFLPLPGTPTWTIDPTSDYATATVGNIKNSLSWFNDPFAAAWTVYRSAGTLLASPDATVDNTDNTYTISFDSADFTRTIPKGTELFTETFPAGEVKVVTVSETNEIALAFGGVDGTLLLNDTNNGGAQSFTVGGTGRTLSSFACELAAVGSPTGTAVMRLYSDAASLPATLLATSDLIEVDTLGAAATINFNFKTAQQFAMLASTAYWAAIEYSAGTAGDYITVGTDVGGGLAGAHAILNGAWATGGTPDMPIEVRYNVTDIIVYVDPDADTPVANWTAETFYYPGGYSAQVKVPYNNASSIEWQDPNIESVTLYTYKVSAHDFLTATAEGELSPTRSVWVGTSDIQVKLTDKLLAQGAVVDVDFGIQSWTREINIATGGGVQSVRIVYDFDRPETVIDGGGTNNLSRSYTVNVAAAANVKHILEDGAASAQTFFAQDDAGTTIYDETFTLTVEPYDDVGATGNQGPTTTLVVSAIQDEPHIEINVANPFTSYADSNRDALLDMDDSDTALVAQVFSVSGGNRNLHSVSFHMDRTGTPGDLFWYEIRENDGSDNPESNVFATSESYPAGSVSTSGEIITLLFPANTVLINSTTYHAVVVHLIAGATNFISVGIDSSSGSFGELQTSPATVEVWTPPLVGGTSDSAAYFSVNEIGTQVVPSGGGSSGSQTALNITGEWLANDGRVLLRDGGAGGAGGGGGGGGGATDLDGLTDVTITAAVNLDVLAHNGSNWGDVALTAAHIQSGTLPVTIGGTGRLSPTTGNLLVGAGTSAMTLLAPGVDGGYARSNGSAWVRSTIQVADIPTHTHAAADIISGELVVARGGTGLASQSGVGFLLVSTGATTDMGLLDSGLEGGYVRSSGTTWVRSDILIGDLPNIPAANVDAGTFSGAFTFADTLTMSSAFLNFTGTATDDNFLDWGGSGISLLRKITNQGGLGIGADSSILINAGDTLVANLVGAGIVAGTTTENLWLTADSNVRIISNTQTSWATRHQWTFSPAGITTFPGGGAVSATDVVTGMTWQGTTVAVGFGGTGVANPSIGNLLVGAGSSPVTGLAPGSSGGYVRSNGSTWVRVAGVAIGDLEGWPDTGYVAVSTGASSTSSVDSGASGGYLRSNGTTWVRSILQAVDIPTHTHSANDIISDELAVARGGTGLASQSGVGFLLVSTGATTDMGLLDSGLVGGFVRSTGTTWARSAGVPAADLTGGTFAGGYTFAAQLDLQHASDQMLRLRHTSATGNPGIVLFQNTTNERARLIYLDTNDSLQIRVELATARISFVTGATEEHLRITGVAAAHGEVRVLNAGMYWDPDTTAANVIDWRQGNLWEYSWTGSRTITVVPATPPDGYHYSGFFNFTSGAGTITFPGTWRWNGGVAPTPPISGETLWVTAVWENAIVVADWGKYT